VNCSRELKGQEKGDMVDTSAAQSLG